MPKRWKKAKGVSSVSTERLKRPVSLIMSQVRFLLMTQMERSFGSEAHCTAVLMMQPFSLSPERAVRR